MFNAYYDNRDFFKDEPFVRILAVINRLNPQVRTFCQLSLYGVDEPMTVQTFEYKLLWRFPSGMNSDGYQPYLIACKNPLGSLGYSPYAVSLVEDPSDKATNNFPVIYNLPEKERKKPFAVCVKQLHLSEDKTRMMVEWIEILSILGVEKIFIYVLSLHPNMLKTLKYYETLGMVKIEMMSLPSGYEGDMQYYQNEMISLNDCLYKHMYEFDFLVPLDIDEIIVPTRDDDKTWMDLMERINDEKETKRNFTSYAAQNVYFLHRSSKVEADIPSNMLFLQHIYRAENFSDKSYEFKSFQNTDKVIVMQNHMPLECTDIKQCDLYQMDVQDARLQHYKWGCKDLPEDQCKVFKQRNVRDVTLWKYKKEIIANVQKTLEALKLK